MKKIELVPILSADEFPEKMVKELRAMDIFIHADESALNIDWEDKNDYHTKTWLVSTYGGDIRKYTRFLIIGG